MKWISILCMAVWLPFAGSALTINASFSNSTSDDDSGTDEDAGKGSSVIGSTSGSVTGVGDSVTLGRRFIGQASAQDGGALQQTIDVSVTWTVTAEDWEEYSITFAPELHALLNILDGAIVEPENNLTFSTFSAELFVNGGSVSDSLNMAGLSQTAADSQTLDRSRSQTLSGYTGSNTFKLQYTATLDVTSSSGVFNGNSAIAGLWGMDGTLSGGYYSDSFDNYGLQEDADADGLFIPATVTLNAVPEPASILMSGVAVLLILGYRRFFGD